MQETNSTLKPTISFDDWLKLDIRVGTVVAAENPNWSNKLIQLTVDFGEPLGQRTIFTAMRQWKTPADFLEKQALFLVNLPPKKMGDAVSEGMILAADNISGDDEPLLLMFADAAPNGSQVQ